MRSTTCSTTGSTETGSSFTARMVSPPPHGLSRGKPALSRSSTRAPPRARRVAVTEPAGPAPTTMTSKRSTASASYVYKIAGAGRGYPVRRLGSLEPLELHLLALGCQATLREPALDTPERLLAEQDLAAVSLRLKPSREVGRNAVYRNVGVRSTRPEDCRADCDADAELQVEQCCLVAERECCLERLHAMVDPVPGNVERRHHGIAGELVDDAEVPLHLGPRKPVERCHALVELLRARLGGERRVAADVREERGDEPLPEGRRLRIRVNADSCRLRRRQVDAQFTRDGTSGRGDAHRLDGLRPRDEVPQQLTSLVVLSGLPECFGERDGRSPLGEPVAERTQLVDRGAQHRRRGSRRSGDGCWPLIPQHARVARPPAQTTALSLGEACPAARVRPLGRASLKRC